MRLEPALRCAVPCSREEAEGRYPSRRASGSVYAEILCVRSGQASALNDLLCGFTVLEHGADSLDSLFVPAPLIANLNPFGPANGFRNIDV